MTHLTHEELLDYIDGNLSDDNNKLIEIHLSECNNCNDTHNFLNSLQEEWIAPNVEVPVTLTKDIMGSIYTPRKNKSIYTHLALAAVATVLFSVVQLDRQLIDSTTKMIGFSQKSIQYTEDTVHKGIKFINEINFEKLGGITHEKTN